ncbi:MULTISPECIES: antitoxin Xre/MbcA/ParS toxin-binding domain-containing protein [Marinobacter]|jgi:uncharacterized protein (DUF2384 family)|uniref:Uncharacterized protein DUF2384 n=1 Tax=Marinobacter nauticus TaxID=2743 RepID=A0A368VA66_MARNT|nr:MULTISPECIES: antitoxin Xre/MbcA/ParS toxin-binding domain-containing protein [Marinobacter]ERS88561.1 hypothetical protein Q667_13455 [Marinobacter sp. C1S70]RBP75745.1 uncharacterized protein DUF2384 [Marinobacter nauticus]RCW36554.1 uncharacterized protein DUF2384 [Marinobacter nauticus]
MPVHESETSGGDDQELLQLKQAAWQDVLELFDVDEAVARDWIGRPRLFLGNVAPECLLKTQADIVRLQRYIQQIQLGIVP